VNAWGEVAENTGYLAGPALAGLLLVVVGGFGTVWVAAALFGLALLVTWFLVPAHLSVRPAPEPYLRSVWDGIRFLLADSTLRAVTLTAAVIWLFLLPFESVVLNAYLNESGQVVAFGVILAAYAGGAIAGALAYGAIAHRVPTRVALIVALALAGLSLGAFAVLPSVPVMVALALAAGVVTGPINPLCALIVQSRTPERFRGRVIGSYTALALAAGPLGLLAFGPLVDTYGPAAGFAVIGGGLLLAALLAAGAPGLRRLAGSA